MNNAVTDDHSRYRLLMKLGSGGMGEVHLALAKGRGGFQKLVVLKLLKATLVGNARAEQMFGDEARLSARIAHPNVVQIFEVIEFEGVPGIVMEHLDGCPLSTVLRAMREGEVHFPLALRLLVISRLLMGLDACHELKDFDGTPMNLVHRDVSPQNVFVLFDGRVKLLDFGVAKSAASQDQTEFGELKGKLRYVAPEQIEDGSQDRRIDVFAAGVLLYEAVSGTRLWTDCHDADVIVRLNKGDIGDPSVFAAMPAELREICQRALKGLREERYQTAKEFHDALEAYRNAEQPATNEELSAYMLEHFAEVRAEKEQIVQKAVAHVSTTPPPRSGAASTRFVDDDEPTRAVTEVVARPSISDEEPTRIEATPHALRDSSKPGPGGEDVEQVPPPINSRRRRSGPMTAALWLVIAALAAAVTWMALDRDNGVEELTQSLSSDRTTQANRTATSSATPDARDRTASTCPSGTKSCLGECVSQARPEWGCDSADCNACSIPHATPRCGAKGQCAIAICHNGYGNCDGSATNGCETDLRFDPDHCGGCGQSCPDLPNAVRGCGDECTIWRCKPGYRDCNGEPADGCEVAEKDPTSCHHCGLTCKGQCVDGECTE